MCRFGCRRLVGLRRCDGENLVWRDRTEPFESSGSGRRFFNDLLAGSGVWLLCAAMASDFPELCRFGGAFSRRVPPGGVKAGNSAARTPLGSIPRANGDGIRRCYCGLCDIPSFCVGRRYGMFRLPFLGTAAVLSALFPRLALAPIDSIKYELLSGSMLFCAAFLLNDPVTSPRTGLGAFATPPLAG